MTADDENSTCRRFAQDNGACLQSQKRTICSINVGKLLTHVAICVNGQVVDTACLDLGYDCLQLDADLIVTEISEGGETFLDAVAKRIRVGDRVEPAMIELIGELIAETIINLVVRKKPPQVSQRLLNTEPLSAHYQVQRCIISGLPSGADTGAIGLRSTLPAGLQGGLRERNIDFEIAQLAPNMVAEEN
ncbi:MAG TPA: ethanolamine ammonia-lyase reactivating factor EutA [Candidatus Obscuribacterales bacterium]